MANFRAHSKVEIPAWLTGTGWSDSSWGNDACPSAEFALGEDVLRVWVNYPQHPEEREVDSVYAVQVLRGGEFDGSEATLYEGDDEAECRALVEMVLEAVATR